MRSLILVVALAAGVAPICVAQESKPAKQQAQEPSAKQLKVLLKKLIASLRSNKTEVVTESVRSIIPAKAAVEGALTPEGFKALGGKVQAYAKDTFGSGPRSALEKLGVTADYRHVEVYTATTEDLMSMEAETVAAREFASGLRTAAAHLKPGATFYCAWLYPTDAEDDPRAGVRLQLFYYHEDRFVFLGPVWKFQKQG